MFVEKCTQLASLAAAAAALTACAGGASVPSGPPTAFVADRAPVPSPSIKRRLLYVSDYNNSVVLVLDYPSGTTAKTLTGFDNPQGMCADTGDHNVFIANSGAQNVLEYAYGASSPKATYNITGEYPAACSIDPTTGNLAVADIFGTTAGSGAVTICTKPSHCKTYTQGIPTSAYSVAYAGNGDLYVSGLNSFGFAMGYLPAGGSTWKAVSFSGSTINFPGGMQWDGKYLAIGDQSGPSGYSVVYRCKAAGASVGCDDRRVDLLQSSDVVAFFIKYGGSGIVGAAGGNIDTWPYPAGGNPAKVIPLGGSYPLFIGTVVLRPQ